MRRCVTAPAIGVHKSILLPLRPPGPITSPKNVYSKVLRCILKLTHRGFKLVNGPAVPARVHKLDVWGVGD